ncbi:glycosyltransferase family 2 protein [Halorubellus sp. JP-L1]|uniref:glycosyltransferase family 2 protein n=1 Tax=Halorubellus sp. JP-L1 TaxID=2715753 RepID=UPI001408A53C|nr:glycosyltransferase family 2 protein [Halorubellus sp. JP-L1]NHN40959.1 glycosyltransferase family 2 protein [Halorubellus sp. JP-L1]
MSVSVIIPAYNESKNILRAVDSVLAQTYEELECIVVDDGSEDNTVERVESYDDSRVRCIKHDVNRGRSAARNTGINAASGDYIAFLDSDDQWVPEKLEHQLQYLNSKPDSWVAAYCGVTQKRRNVLEQIAGAVFNSGSKKEGGTELIKEVLSTRASIHPGSTLLIERNIATSIGGFDESIHINEDLAFIVEILSRGKLAYFDEQLSIIHRSNYVDGDTIKREKEKFLNKFSNTVYELESEGYSVICKHNYVVGKAYLREGQFKRGVNYLRNACIESVEDVAGIIWSFMLGVLNNPSED